MKKNIFLITLLALSSSIVCPMDVPHQPFPAIPASPHEDTLNRLVLAINTGDLATVNMILSQPNVATFINDFDAQGRTALTAAALKCNEAVALKLLAAGANPNVRNREGYTPLMFLACNRGPKRMRALAQPVPLNAQDIFDDQAVCMPVLDVLLEHGADANVANNTGQTPLFFALQYGNRRVADGIIQFIPASDLDTLLVGCASMNRLDLEERPVMPLEIRRDALCEKLKQDVLNAQMARIGYMNLRPVHKTELGMFGYPEDVIRQKIRDGIDARMRTHKMPKIETAVEIKK